jgi:LacI family transcriptional regulator
MTAAGLDVDPRLIVHADYTPAGGGAAMRALLAVSERPTAVLVANVASAVGALHAVHAHGLRVPQDISVIAIHDMPLASHLVPALTTVRMPLGARAIEVLATSQPDDDITEIVTDPVEVVVRESTSAPSPTR